MIIVVYCVCAVFDIKRFGNVDIVSESLQLVDQLSARAIYVIILGFRKNQTVQRGGFLADIAVEAVTGPEVVTGSTRMKAGTAQKLVLNMLSTCVMIKSGNVFENLMINLKPTNVKLKQRMIGIVCDITGCGAKTSEELLEKSEWSIRAAVELYK